MNNIKDIYKNIPVFIYCSAKCGSMTLTKTLSQYYNTFHVHGQKDFVDYYKETTFNIFDVVEYNSKTNKDIYIIDVYRTPIERKISSFFQNIDKHFPNYKKYNIRSLIKFFNCGFIYNLEETQSIDEIMNFYDVPLFTQFDYDKGYNIVHKDNIHFIKLRFKDIDKWSAILSEIFKINVSLVSDNISENKNYSKIYKAFKKYYYIPKDYYYELLPRDNNFLIYNTLEEQKEYYEKWEKRLLPET